jgi:hypothetical protein
MLIGDTAALIMLLSAGTAAPVNLVADPPVLLGEGHGRMNPASGFHR